MKRGQSPAGKRQAAAVAAVASPRWKTALAALLLGLGALVCGEASAAGFDWRSRGVLFRVEPSLPLMPSVVAPAAAPDPAAPDPASATASAVDPAIDQTASDPAWSYLFATIHYGNAEELALDLPRLRERLRETRVLVNEVSGAEQWRPEYEQYRALPPGGSLRKLLGDAAFARLQLQLPDNDAATLDGLKPWVVMSMLELPESRDRASAEDSLDVQLEDWARAAGLRLVHLENLPEQLAALDCVPAQDYAEVLGQRLRAGWSFEQEARRTAGYYRRRDLPAWFDEIERMPGLEGAAIAIEQHARRCLIEARNARWLPVLEVLLREGRCFVAVGAIHLTGEHGLLAQLSRRGFTVTVEPW